jgi:hypothetical protein
MSQISKAVSNASFGAIAISLTLGAVQFASGHDLTGGFVAGLGAGPGFGTASAAHGTNPDDFDPAP